MNKFICLCVMAIMMVITPSFAQDSAAYTRVNNTFIATSASRSSNAVKTKYTFVTKDSISHPIYITPNNACYILCISKKTGKEYKRYLPKEITAQICKELKRETK